MTTSSTPAIYSALATQLTQSRPLSDEEKLFRDAFRAVENARRQSNKELPEFFENLRVARTIEDVHLALRIQKQRNPFWSQWVGSKWLEHLGKLAECILQYKTVVDSFMPRSQNIAGPIWSVFAFLFGVLKDLTQTTQEMKEIERTLEQSKLRFKRLFEPGKTLSEDLKTALRSYYEAVLEFAIDIHAEFSRTWVTGYASISTLLNVVGAIPQAFHRTVKSRLSGLSSVIYKIIYDVDQGASYDRDGHVIDKLSELQHTIQQTKGSTLGLVTSGAGQRSRGLVHGLPPVSFAFTGRLQYLNKIWRSLHLGTGQSNRAAVYGMGGIGKSQLLQKYASDNIKSSVNPAGYDIVLYVNSHDASSIAAAISTFMQAAASIDPSLNFSKDKSSTNHTFLASWLQHRENWLLVLDDVHDYNDVAPLLSVGSVGHILCSTRHKLIANQIAGTHNSLEVLGLNEADSVALIQRLAQSGSHELDSSQGAVLEVARFAKGLPLLIEQVVHNTVMRKSTFTSTLESIREKSQLLAQRNIASLHEHNLSLGAVVMQALDTIRSACDKAEALFMLMAYMDPSSIPLKMIREGAKQFQHYLNRPHTFDRGSVYTINESTTDTIALRSREARDDRTDDFQKLHFWEEADPLRPSTWKTYFKSKAAKKADSRAILPRDDKDILTMLRQHCGPETPLGRLFANKFMLDDALVILCDAGVIRQLDGNIVWMHDLVAEITRALIETGPTHSHRMALPAAITVFLAFPVPHRSVSPPERRLCHQYLPHAISCHHSLKSLGILNDCSLGPELCHTIASTMCACGFLSERHDRDWNLLTMEQRNELRNQVVSYYTEAFDGYMASWQRLMTVHRIDAERIMLATRADRDREVRRTHRSWVWSMDRYATDQERLGRNAPWRAAQTALRLSRVLEENSDNVEQAVALTRIVVQFYKQAFGVSDIDTRDVKSILYHQLGHVAQRWHDVYTATVEDIKDLTGWDGCLTKLTVDGGADALRATMITSSDAASCARRASLACLNIFKSCGTTPHSPEAQKWIEEAIIFGCIDVDHVQRRYGDGAFELSPRLKDQAGKHELAGNASQALECYAKATCSATHSVQTGLDTRCGHSASFVLETIEEFNQARVRLREVIERDGMSADLDKCIREAEAKIEWWTHAPPEQRTTDWSTRHVPWQVKLEGPNGSVIISEETVLASMGCAEEEDVSLDVAVEETQ